MSGQSGNAGVGGQASCKGEELSGLVERARYEADLVAIAQPRPAGSPGWKVVQDRCADRLAALGYQVERQNYGTGINVVGTLFGTDKASEKVILSAHYDSVPDCAGADDNGTGVAGVLEAARVLAQGKYNRTLVIACWDEEERGLIGSRAYATKAKAAGETITAAFVYEMIGYKSDVQNSQKLPQGYELLFPEQAAAVQSNGSKGDFIAVVGDSSMQMGQAAFLSAAKSLGLPTISTVLAAEQKNNPLFGDLRRSDHASFWGVDYPALMLTDTADFRNPHYHCDGGPDAVADLDGAFAEKIVKATVWAVVELLQAR